MNAPSGGWSALPRPPDEPVGFSDEVSPEIVGPAPVVGLGAICDLDETSQDGRAQSFAVSEFALLNDGRRVILQSDRGFTIGLGTGSEVPSDLATAETTDSITRDVLNVVLPDDDDSGDEHPWEWLADLAQARGLDVTAADLQVLPYQVILTASVSQWLQSA